MDDASTTAEWMALFRTLESGQPAPLFVDPSAAAFLTGIRRVIAGLSRLPGGRRFVPWAIDRRAPGPRPSAVVRTRLIDDLVREAVIAGAEQVVILGAGFDTRANRLPELADVPVFEVDHALTQARKRALLGTAGNRVRFVATDLERGDLAHDLRTVGYDTQQPAVAIWEGVTNYLTADAVDRSFRLLAGIGAPRTRIIFTYVDRAVFDDPGRFPEAERWMDSVAKSEEPWRFGFDPHEVAGYLSGRGFALLSDVSTADAARAFEKDLGRREKASSLYHVAVAERST